MTSKKKISKAVTGLMAVAVVMGIDLWYIGSLSPNSSHNTTISAKSIEISISHEVPTFLYSCFQDYKLRVILDTPLYNKEDGNHGGMAIYREDVKKIIQEKIGAKKSDKFLYCHQYAEDSNNFKELDSHVIIQEIAFEPSVENMAKYFYELLKTELGKSNIDLKYIELTRTFNTPVLHAPENQEAYMKSVTYPMPVSG